MDPRKQERHEIMGDSPGKKTIKMTRNLENVMIERAGVVQFREGRYTRA